MRFVPLLFRGTNTYYVLDLLNNDCFSTPIKHYKPVVDVARDAQCCVHTRDSSCRGQTDGLTDGWTDTVLGHREPIMHSETHLIICLAAGLRAYPLGGELTAIARPRPGLRDRERVLKKVGQKSIV